MYTIHMMYTVLYMPATRTQIYLTSEQRKRIDTVARSAGVSMAEIIRRAVDGYMDRYIDPGPALEATFGAVPDAAAPSRDEWERG